MRLIFLYFSLRLLYSQVGPVGRLGGTDNYLNAQSPPYPLVCGGTKAKGFKRYLELKDETWKTDILC